MTASFAETAPELNATLANLQNTLVEAAAALDSFEKVMISADEVINDEGQNLAGDLRYALSSVSLASTALTETLEAVQPAAEQLAQTTIPAAESTMRELEATSRVLRQVTDKLESQGAASILRGQTMPDYKP